jgi:lipoate-protein ligase A
VPAPLHVFHDPPLDGPTNMARDEHLLYSETFRPAALRIYGWTPPTISLGYFQHHADVAGLPADVRDLAVVRRVTGGGAILHDREVTYCLTLDQTVPIVRRSPVDLYRLVHGCWRDALALDGGPQIDLAPDDFPMPTPRTGPFFCFEKPGRTDLIIGPDKLLGSAQRRLPERVLQHGSLLLGRRFESHPGASLGDPPAERVARWVSAFIAALAAQLDLTPQDAAWSADQDADIAERRAHYASDEWNQRR